MPLEDNAFSFPDPVAQLDQFKRALADVADVVLTYHRELLDAGASETEALAFACAMQTAWLMPRPEAGADD